MSKYSRIVYNNIKIDFDRGLTAFSPFPIQEKVVNFSASGIAETLNYYRYWTFAFARAHAHAGLKNQLMAFWDYVRTGASFSFWHDRDLAGYFNFEGKSLESADEIDGTFTRATASFYDDPTTGFLAEVNSGVARFPAGKFGRGILIERAATNILTKSTEFNDASWNATNITVTTNTTATRSPALSGYDTTAELAELTAASGSFQKDTSTNIGTTDAIFSVYLKTHEAGTKSGTLYIKRADTDATLASQAITITSTWQRFYIGYDHSDDIMANWRVRIELNGSSGNDFAIWGGMLEISQNVFYPSTFVFTSTVSTTRNAESLTYGASNFFNDEPTQGTIAFWFKPNFSNTDLIGGTFALLEVDSVDSSVMLQLHLTAANGIEFYVINKSGGNGISALAALGSFSVADFIHIAVTWDTTISNGGKVYLNGTLAATSTNSAFAPKRIGTNFHLGKTAAGSNHANGIFDDLLIRKDVLDAVEIYDTAQGRQPLGYDRNYWSALMIEERQFTLNRLAGVPLWDIEIPVREVLS